MNFFELVDQFFQLNSQQPIPPLAAKLYLYWLHEFNQARWPQVLYRRANQVYADLPCDKNTFGRAVTQLQERGLLDFDTTSKGWQLNYGPAADWLPAGVVKNSPQPAAAVVNNSPQPAPSMVHNSPQDVAESAEKLHLMVKNSPPIRNNQYVLEENQPTPSASECAWVGEAAEEITPAPLPTEISELVPPVALTPQPARPAPAAGAVPALAEALAEEAKTLASTIGALWFITEQRNQPKWARIHTFCRRLALLGRLPEVQQQFAGYRLQREKAGLRPHQLDSWLGTPALDFADGEWTGCDWPAVAAATTTRPGQSAEATPPARATTSARKAQTSWS